MKKTFKITALIGLLVMLLLGGIYFVIYMQNPYMGIDEIKTIDTLEQKEDEYYVYYYMRNCPDCIKVQEGFFEFARSNTVYVVNVVKDKSRKKFDWEGFHEENDKLIGHIQQDGTKEYYTGENEEKYLNNEETNKYGKLNRYEVIVADKEYLLENKNAKIDEIYASMLRPAIDYASVVNSEDVVVAAVPTLLHIKNGRIVDDYFDSPELLKFFNMD